MNIKIWANHFMKWCFHLYYQQEWKYSLSAILISQYMDFKGLFPNSFQNYLHSQIWKQYNLKPIIEVPKILSAHLKQFFKFGVAIAHELDCRKMLKLYFLFVRER